jgi:hypothetical protein
MADIKKIKIGSTTYDIAVSSIDKVAGLREILNDLSAEHAVEGNVLVIGESSQGTTSATPITKIQVAEGTYKIKDPEASRIIEIVDLTA